MQATVVFLVKCHFQISAIFENLRKNRKKNFFLNLILRGMITSFIQYLVFIQNFS